MAMKTDNGTERRRLASAQFRREELFPSAGGCGSLTNSTSVTPAAAAWSCRTSGMALQRERCVGRNNIRGNSLAAAMAAGERLSVQSFSVRDSELMDAFSLHPSPISCCALSAAAACRPYCRRSHSTGAALVGEAATSQTAVISRNEPFLLREQNFAARRRPRAAAGGACAAAEFSIEEDDEESQHVAVAAAAFRAAAGAVRAAAAAASAAAAHQEVQSATLTTTAAVDSAQSTRGAFFSRASVVRLAEGRCTAERGALQCGVAGSAAAAVDPATALQSISTTAIPAAASGETTAESSSGAEAGSTAVVETAAGALSMGNNAETRAEIRDCSNTSTNNEAVETENAYVGADCFFVELPDGVLACVAGLENLPLPPTLENVVGGTGNTGNNSEITLARLQCHNCLQLLEFDNRAFFVQCSSCSTLNAVQNQEYSLRGGRAMIVICGRCNTSNISCMGSHYVECWHCHTICQVAYPSTGTAAGPHTVSRATADRERERFFPAAMHLAGSSNSTAGAPPGSRPFLTSYRQQRRLRAAALSRREIGHVSGAVFGGTAATASPALPLSRLSLPLNFSAALPAARDRAAMHLQLPRSPFVPSPPRSYRSSNNRRPMNNSSSRSDSGVAAASGSATDSRAISAPAAASTHRETARRVAALSASVVASGAAGEPSLTSSSTLSESTAATPVTTEPPTAAPAGASDTRLIAATAATAQSGHQQQQQQSVLALTAVVGSRGSSNNRGLSRFLRLRLGRSSTVAEEGNTAAPGATAVAAAALSDEAVVDRRRQVTSAARIFGERVEGESENVSQHQSSTSQTEQAEATADTAASGPFTAELSADDNETEGFRVCHEGGRRVGRQERETSERGQYTAASAGAMLEKAGAEEAQSQAGRICTEVDSSVSSEESSVSLSSSAEPIGDMARFIPHSPSYGLHRVVGSSSLQAQSSQTGGERAATVPLSPSTQQAQQQRDANGETTASQAAAGAADAAALAHDSAVVEGVNSHAERLMLNTPRRPHFRLWARQQQHQEQPRNDKAEPATDAICRQQLNEGVVAAGMPSSRCCSLDFESTEVCEPADVSKGDANGVAASPAEVAVVAGTRPSAACKVKDSSLHGNGTLSTPPCELSTNSLRGISRAFASVVAVTAAAAGTVRPAPRFASFGARFLANAASTGEKPMQQQVQHPAADVRANSRSFASDSGNDHQHERKPDEGAEQWRLENQRLTGQCEVNTERRKTFERLLTAVRRKKTAKPE